MGSLPNKFQPWVDFAKTIDAFRVFPRIFIISYLYLLHQTAEWFMALPAPTLAQSGLISVVIGAGAAWFGLYVNSGGGTIQFAPKPEITKIKPKI